MQLKIIRGPRRDIIWEELEEIFGKVTNANTRGRRNRVVKLIRESIFEMAATAPRHFPRDDEQVRREIRRRHRMFTSHWPGVKPTDTALANRWDDCDPHSDDEPVLNQPRPVSMSPAPAAVAGQYIDEMKRRGWIRGADGPSGAGGA